MTTDNIPTDTYDAGDTTIRFTPARLDALRLALDFAFENGFGVSSHHVDSLYRSEFLKLREMLS